MNGLRALALPLEWIMRVSLLVSFIVVHILISPFRACVYWWRGMSITPTMKSIFDSTTEPIEIGLSCPRSRSEGA